MVDAGNGGDAGGDASPPGPTAAEGLGPQEQARLLGRYGRRFAAGDTLFQEGTPASEAFLLQEGRVRLLRRVAMAERSLAVLKPGDLFGESTLLERTGRAEGTERGDTAAGGDGASILHSSTAVALTDGVLLALDRGTLRSLLQRHPDLAVRAVEQLAVRLRDAEDQIEIMMLRGVQSKVTSALLKLAGKAAGFAALSVSPVELSTRVGLDVEAVKRTVTRLRERHYIRIAGERIEIPDVEALRRLHALLGTKDELAGASEDA